MVLFHLCYDLRFIYGYPLSFFKPPFQDIWRASISWTFLFIAGCMCSFSRNNLKRAARYLAAAALIYIVTWVVAVDTPISFGIIFCMGGSTLIYHALDQCNRAPEGIPAACVLFAAFLLLRGVPHGYLGIGSLQWSLPSWLYASNLFSFAGFPGPHFTSGDYYPLIPFALMYLTGAAIGRMWHKHGYPSWFAQVSCPPLQLVGQHALPIYILHQPLIIGLIELWRAIGF